MEHPFRIILRAFGIVVLAAVTLYAVPHISRTFGREEWLLAIGFFILFVLLMLLQVYASAGKLLKKINCKTHSSKQ